MLASAGQPWRERTRASVRNCYSTVDVTVLPSGNHNRIRATAVVLSLTLNRPRLDQIGRERSSVVEYVCSVEIQATADTLFLVSRREREGGDGLWREVGPTADDLLSQTGLELIKQRRASDMAQSQGSDIRTQWSRKVLIGHGLSSTLQRIQRGELIKLGVTVHVVET